MNYIQQLRRDFLQGMATPHLSETVKEFFFVTTVYPVEVTSIEIERYELIQRLNILPFGIFNLIGNTLHKQGE